MGNRESVKSGSSLPSAQTEKGMGPDAAKAPSDSPFPIPDSRLYADKRFCLASFLRTISRLSGER